MQQCATCCRPQVLRQSTGTWPGASAVGDAATRAVVTGIILLVVVDGLFAVAYYLLNI